MKTKTLQNHAIASLIGLCILVFVGCASSKTKASEPPAPPQLSPLDAAMATKKDEFRFCYERAVNSKEGVGNGKVTLDWTILPSGTPMSVHVLKTTLHNEDVEQCLIRTVKTIRFVTVAKPTEVKYPFAFDAR